MLDQELANTFLMSKDLQGWMLSSIIWSGAIKIIGLCVHNKWRAGIGN